jgi:hypothetical protein
MSRHYPLASPFVVVFRGSSSGSVSRSPSARPGSADNATYRDKKQGSIAKYPRQ